MPEHIAAWLVQIGVDAAVAAVIAEVVVTLATSYAVAALTAQGNGAITAADGKVEIRQSVMARRRYFGEVETAGSVAFYDSRDGRLYKLCVLQHGLTVERLQHRINDRVVYLSSSGVVYDSAAYAAANNFEADLYKGKMKLIFQDGTDDQTAIPILEATYTEWDSDHRCRGLSTALLMANSTKAEEFRTVYINGGEPVYTQRRKAGTCYDPRLDSTNGGSGPHRVNDKDTWEYTRNLALQVGTFMLDPDGFGAKLTPDDINWAVIAEEATVCEDTFVARDTTTVNRYDACGGHDCPGGVDTLDSFMVACDGFHYQDADGKFCLRVGRWIEPTVHLDYDSGCFLSVQAMADQSGITDYDAVKVVYTDYALGVAQVDAAAVSYIPGHTVTTEDRISQIRADFIPHHNQAARVAKRAARRMAAVWTLSCQTNMTGFAVVGERFIRCTIPPLGIDNQAFEVAAHALYPASQRTEMTLISVDEEDFDFGLDEEGEPPSIPGNTILPVSIPVPEDVTAEAVQLDLGASNGVGLTAAWTEPSRDDLNYQAQFALHGVDLWAAMAVDNDSLTAASGPVVSGEIYDVRVRSLTALGTPSAWVLVASITATADNDPDAAPATPVWAGTPLTSPAAGLIVVHWTASTSSNSVASRVYRNTVDTFGSATLVYGLTSAPAQACAWNDTGLTSATAYYYWITSANADNVQSSPTDSETITAT